MVEPLSEVPDDASSVGGSRRPLYDSPAPTASSSTAGTPPPLQAVDSAVGRDASFRAASEEITRVMRLQKNYYAVLKVNETQPKADVRFNYHRLIEILTSPEAAKLPQSQEAAAIVNSAYGTLVNAFKKRLFDKYLEEHHTATPNASESYDEWEADQTKRPPQVPSWATRVLKIPGGGLFMLCVCFPFTLLCLLLLALLLAFILPMRWCYLCCCLKDKDKLQEPTVDSEGTEKHPGGASAV